jgi:hypothetical protein
METSIKTILAKATTKILKPLIRVLMRNEISHGEFAEFAKRAYMEVAYEHFSIPGRKTTYSRVAILTGLNRKEIVRLTQQSASEIHPRKGTTNRALRVVTGWLNDPDFLDDKEQPKTLPIKGDNASFNTLAIRYSGDITARAILEELKRLGIVKITAERDLVQLLSCGYIPQNDKPEQIEIMSISATDLLETVAHNLEHEKEELRFQRQLIHRDVPESIVKEFKTYSHNKSSALLSELNQWLIHRMPQEPDDAKYSVKRVGVGIYYFEEHKKTGGEKDGQLKDKG